VVNARSHAAQYLLTSELEAVVDPFVGSEKLLGLAGRIGPPDVAFPSSGELMFNRLIMNRRMIVRVEILDLTSLGKLPALDGGCSEARLRHDPR
jgi:hypothetical protein